MVTRPAHDALVAPTADTSLAHGGAFLAALSVVAEKSTGALRDAHPASKTRVKEEQGSQVRKRPKGFAKVKPDLFTGKMF